ncbi:RsmB/NOP family class I SAM-dependent RNA methyltransferase [Luteithermobacter gelatinilyticus]|uniref:RsmB/NOP family class I SAM-dependent RNA methyltransferase n=1 Tax=Luteithermobacter gelatinilyticus TaxID=2582913 RepID=UPI001106528B|nr:RsmB/NOP family class I SAM-dependent RNA methyltransferase [Luteithermobacter gelatinilyticus]
MQDHARVQAVIDLVEEVHHSLEQKGPAADMLVRQYFRSRRYAGSRDRRLITDMLYNIIRGWGSFRASMEEFSARKMVLAFLISNGTAREEIDTYFGGATHGPAPLTPEEQCYLDHLKIPERRCPEWMENRLRGRFGEELDEALSALNERAPLNLRVNTLKTNRENVCAILREHNIDGMPGQWGPQALIVPTNTRIRDLDLYKKGLVEFQDEAAQIAVSLCGLVPGQQVVDFCAGGGGKSLAAAAVMQNRGQICAFDISKARLADLKPRAKRAGVHILQSRGLAQTEAERQKQLAPVRGKMDRVLVDVPCSGSGTWRRNPEAKWRLEEKDLMFYVHLQQEILDQAWPLVREGGRLVYMTCSLFEEENENQVEQFLRRHKTAVLKDYRDTAPGRFPETFSLMAPCLLLVPHRHGTDGFFVAIMEKKTVS